MLELRDVDKTYRGARAVEALRGIALAVEPGAFVALQGPSGCGKTTLLLVAGGLLAPDAGRVTWGGVDVYARSPDGRARLRAEAVGFVFQQFHLVPYLTARENVLAPALAAPVAGAAARADELLGRFGLSDRAGHVPAALSTGERQRTALARALLRRPRLILADEPTGNLDEANAAAVLDALAAYAREGGSVLLVTHDRDVAARAGRIVRMESGRLAAGVPAA
jgi:ABC-type lipoprotein export system ATPase subunit